MCDWHAGRLITLLMDHFSRVIGAYQEVTGAVHVLVVTMYFSKKANFFKPLITLQFIGYLNQSGEFY